MIGAEFVEFVHEIQLQKPPGQGPAPLEEHAACASRRQFVEEVAQAASSGAGREAEILDAGQGRRFAHDRAQDRLSGDRAPHAPVAGKATLAIQDDAVEDAVHR
jgi:hypothetical protein